MWKFPLTTFIFSHLSWYARKFSPKMVICLLFDFNILLFFCLEDHIHKIPNDNKNNIGSTCITTTV